jgi:hypothetical protein
LGAAPWRSVEPDPVETRRNEMNRLLRLQSPALAVAFIALIGASVAGGCGGSDDDTKAAAQSPVPVVTSPVAENDKGRRPKPDSPGSAGGQSSRSPKPVLKPTNGGGQPRKNAAANGREAGSSEKAPAQNGPSDGTESSAEPSTPAEKLPANGTE